MIYILKLENNKYYVGYSKNTHTCDVRLINHFNKNGSEWTKKYKPISVISKINGDMFDEEKHTLLYMDKYGVDNVRGGSYAKITLSQNEREKAIQTIRSVLNRCYICNSAEHYAKCCPNRSNKQQNNVGNETQPRVYSYPHLDNLERAHHLLMGLL